MKFAIIGAVLVTLTVSGSLAAPKKENCFDCVCTTSYDPVCGSNGETYANKCNLACAQGCNSKIKLAYRGQCGSQKDSAVETTTQISEDESATTERMELSDDKEDIMEIEETKDEEPKVDIMVQETTSKPQADEEKEQTTSKNIKE